MEKYTMLKVAIIKIPIIKNHFAAAFSINLLKVSPNLKDR
tara:strand:+ start:1664 stop:1783 length:120 start_codon:yes stop_codon:yes gene_type:complete